MFYEVYDMETLNWEQNGKLAHLRTFIREGEIRNTTIQSPQDFGLTLKNPFNKHEEFHFRHIGKDCQFNASDNGYIRIEQEAYLGERCVIYAVGAEVRIGERLKMSPNACIYASQHDTFDKERTKAGRVLIGDDVWIGDNAKIMRGVYLANNCTVGANAVVTKPFQEPYSVIGGNPAKLLYIAEEGR